MLAVILSHQTMILTVALTLSELLAFVFPSAGGILKAAVTGLRSIGAKDVDGQ